MVKIKAKYYQDIYKDDKKTVSRSIGIYLKMPDGLAVDLD